MIKIATWRYRVAACIAAALIARLLIVLAPVPAAAQTAVILCTAEGPVALAPGDAPPRPHHHDECGICGAALLIAAPPRIAGPQTAPSRVSGPAHAVFARGLDGRHFARAPPTV